MARHGKPPLCVVFPAICQADVSIAIAVLSTFLGSGPSGFLFLYMFCPFVSCLSWAYPCRVGPIYGAAIVNYLQMNIESPITLNDGKHLLGYLMRLVDNGTPEPSGSIFAKGKDDVGPINRLSNSSMMLSQREEAQTQHCNWAD